MGWGGKRPARAAAGPASYPVRGAWLRLVVVRRGPAGARAARFEQAREALGLDPQAQDLAARERDEARGRLARLVHFLPARDVHVRAGGAAQRRVVDREVRRVEDLLVVGLGVALEAEHD